MVDRKQLQYIELSDFKPGISSSYHSLVGDDTMPDGYAREEFTYNCFGLQTGGLGPLPRLAFSREGGDPALDPDEYPNLKWPNVADGYPPYYNRRIAVLDAVVVSPVTLSPPLGQAVNNDLDNVDLFTVRQWYMVNTADTKVESIWRFRGHPVYTGNTTGAFAAKEIHALHYSPSWNPDPSRWKYGWGSIMQTRTQAHDLDKNVIGPPVLVCGMGGMIRLGGVNTPDEEGIECASYFSYPDYYDDNGLLPIAVDRTHDIEVNLGAALPGMVFGHQGRLLAIGRQSSYRYGRLLAYHGDEYGVMSTTELLYYWPPNDVYSDSFKIASFAEEEPSGYGTWHTANANSLLLIKTKGGAVLINGDVNSPAVTRLPGVPPTGQYSSRGTTTDKGFAYGSNSGVWMWTGSDTGVNLSPTLRPDFWVPDDPTIERRQLGQLTGSFAFKYPFIYAPNNWIMDMRSGGWFRYYPTPTQDPDDGLTLAFNEVDYIGNHWVTVASYHLDTFFYGKFDPTQPVNRYVWHSQPLVKSRNQFLDFRSVNVLVSGMGRIKITVSSPGESPQTTTLESSSNTMTSLNGNLGITGKNIEVEIEAEAYNESDPAPTVLRVSIGYMEGSGIGEFASE